MTLQEVGQKIKLNKDRFTSDELVFLRLLYEHNQHYMPAGVVCALAELNHRTSINERQLRGEDGLRATTSKKLFDLTGWKIVSKTSFPSGYKMTDNQSEWKEAERQIASHATSELHATRHFARPSLPELDFEGGTV